MSAAPYILQTRAWLRPLWTVRFAGVVLGVVLLAACSGGVSDQEEEDAAAVAIPQLATRVPVSVAAVQHEDLNVTVDAPGRTETLRRDRIRAPFEARLMALRVSDGDRVGKGQVVAVLASRNSEAALQGARRMLAAAKSAADKTDARRAVQVTRQNLVRQSLTAPADGVVLSHAAETGDYIDVNEVLVTIAETGGVYFQADVTQSEIEHVRPGQQVNIDMPALGPHPVTAVVQGLLPVASSENFSAPVRLDFKPRRKDIPLGLFGSAGIVIDRHENATVVPPRALLRNDVTGVTRLAVVESNGTAHWLTVTTGVRGGDRVEIIEPAITAGMRVITDGQVGLPEGAKVVVQQ